MITTLQRYSVTCDRCHVQIDRYDLWRNPDNAGQEARDRRWDCSADNTVHLCPYCTPHRPDRDTAHLAYARGEASMLDCLSCNTEQFEQYVQEVIAMTGGPYSKVSHLCRMYTGLSVGMLVGKYKVLRDVL